MGNYFFRRREQGDVDVAALLTQISRLEKRQEASDARILQLEKENEELHAEIKELRAQIKARDARIRDLEKANEKAQAKINKLNKDFATSDQQRRESERNHRNLKTLFEAETRVTDEKTASLKQSNKDAKAEVVANKKAVEDLEKKVKLLDDWKYLLIGAFLPALFYALYETFLYRFVGQVLASTLSEEEKGARKYGMSKFSNQLLRLLWGDENVRLDDWKVGRASQPGRAEYFAALVGLAYFLKTVDPPRELEGDKLPHKYADQRNIISHDGKFLNPFFITTNKNIETDRCRALEAAFIGMLDKLTKHVWGATIPGKNKSPISNLKDEVDKAVEAVVAGFIANKWRGRRVKETVKESAKKQIYDMLKETPE